MKSYAAQFLVVLVLFIFVSPVSAQTDDWNALASQINKEVAVKAENRAVVFGILTAADSDSVKVKTSDGNKNVSEVSFKREEVENVWLAKLGKDSRKTLQGAAIGSAVGGGIGAGVGLIGLAATGGSDSGSAILAGTTVVGAAIGAVVGGSTGFFSRKQDKKKSLIYKR